MNTTETKVALIGEGSFMKALRQVLKGDRITERCEEAQIAIFYTEVSDSNADLFESANRNSNVLHLVVSEEMPKHIPVGSFWIKPHLQNILDALQVLRYGRKS